jgi:hypothetical protein
MSDGENRKVRDSFNALVVTPRQRFPQARLALAAPSVPGVYVIYDPRGAVAHVGRTNGKRGLHQRLCDHMRNASSFARYHLRGNGSVLREGYTFRYLVIRDARLRALLEAYATGCLCPDHLGLHRLCD